MTTKHEDLIISKWLIGSLIGILAGMLLVMPILQILFVKGIISDHIPGIAGILITLLTSFTVINALLQIKRTSKFKGIADREKEIYAKYDALYNEYKTIKKLISLNNRVSFKIQLYIQIFAFLSIFYWFILDGRRSLAELYIVQLVILAILILLLVSIILSVRFVLSRKNVITVCRCGRINLTGKPNDWISILRDIIEISDVLCPDCMRFLYREAIPDAKIGNILIEQKIISIEQLNVALEKQKDLRGQRLGDIIVNMGFTNRENIEKAYLLQQQKEDQLCGEQS